MTNKQYQTISLTCYTCYVDRFKSGVFASYCRRELCTGGAHEDRTDCIPLLFESPNGGAATRQQLAELQKRQDMASKF